MLETRILVNSVSSQASGLTATMTGQPGGQGKTRRAAAASRQVRLRGDMCVNGWAGAGDDLPDRLSLVRRAMQRVAGGCERVLAEVGAAGGKRR